MLYRFSVASIVSCNIEPFLGYWEKMVGDFVLFDQGVAFESFYQCFVIKYLLLLWFEMYQVGVKERKRGREIYLRA